LVEDPVTEVLELSPSVSITITRGVAIDFDAIVGDAAVDRLCRVGRVPDHLRDETREWARWTIIMMAIVRFEREDPAGNWFTRKQLRSALVALRRQLKSDKPVQFAPWLRAECYYIERARLFHHCLGVAWWHPADRSTFPKVVTLMEAADSRVRAVISNPLEFIKLIEDALDVLRRAPERTSEWYARESRCYSSRGVVENSLGFWSKTLGRSDVISDQLVAFVDAMLRVCGIPKDQVRAVRAQIEAAKARGMSSD
jgi:hypothetical protein